MSNDDISCLPNCWVILKSGTQVFQVFEIGEMLLKPYLQMNSLFSDLSMLPPVVMPGPLVAIAANLLLVLYHILLIKVLLEMYL